MRREVRLVVAVEAVGPYRLVRIDRGGLDPGTPGQFFMLEAPGRLLPRPFSLCCEPRGELGFLVDAVGPGTRAIASVDPGDRIAVLGPLGNGFSLDVLRPLLVGGGIGIAPFPYLSDRLGRPPAVLGFRSAWHAEAAALVPHAEVVIDPVLVTEAIPEGHDVLACGPEPMLMAVAAMAPGAQLAFEAPMACGYGACFGCVVEIDGRLKRLCLEGPVVHASRLFASDVGERTPARGRDKSRPYENMRGGSLPSASPESVGAMLASPSPESVGARLASPVDQSQAGLTR